MRYLYSVTLTPEIDVPGFTVTVADIPEIVTYGATRDAALAAAQDAIDTYTMFLLRDGDDMPVPSAPATEPAVGPSPILVAKVALAAAMRDQGITKTELARRLGCVESEARRILSPTHQTKIQRLDEALGAVGLRMVVDVSAVAA